MKTILYITDSHFKETNPRSRIDNYLESLLEKHYEFCEMVKKLKPTYVLHGGDFFDGPVQSVYLFRKIREMIASSGRVWDIMLGSHPWRGRWSSWKPKSALTALEDLGLIRVHETAHSVILGTLTAEMIHCQMVKEPVPWEHTLWKDYKGEADIFLCSDYHPYQGAEWIEVEGGREVLFVAPGAIVRNAKTQADMEREPCAALIKVKGTVASCKFLKFKSAKPAFEVFDYREEDEPTDNRESFDEAIANLKDFSKQIKIHTVDDVIRVVAKATKTESEVVDRCLDRVNR